VSKRRALTLEGLDGEADASPALAQLLGREAGKRNACLC
jgi:hypothetical protein